MANWPRIFADRERISGIRAQMLTESGAVMADPILSRVHSGQVFSVFSAISNLPDTNSIDIGITTASNDEAHVVFDTDINGLADFLLYEGATLAEGTPLTAFNRNRKSSRTALTNFVSGPSVSATGTLIDQLVIPGVSGNKPSGSPSGYDREMILAPSTVYLARLFNRSGGAARAMLGVEFYEA